MPLRTPAPSQAPPTRTASIQTAPSQTASTQTFRGDQLALAAGAARTIRHIAEAGLARRADLLGAHLQERLTRYQAHHPIIGQVRGVAEQAAVQAAVQTSARASQEVAHV